MGHLEELRSRVLWSLCFWVAGSIIAYQAVPYLLNQTKPMLGPAKLIFTAPTEAFFAYLQLAMVGGLFLSFPILLFNLVMFIMPGLTEREQRWFVALLPGSIVLFLTGAAFAYLAVLPVTLQFFLSFAQGGLEATIKIQDFLGFVVGLMAICGVIFQLPLVLFFGALAGLVKSRFLRAQRRAAYFLAFVVAAVATPTPDALTAAVVAVPILVLFELSILLIRVIGK